MSSPSLSPAYTQPEQARPEHVLCVYVLRCCSVHLMGGMITSVEYVPSDVDPTTIVDPASGSESGGHNH